MEIPSPFLAGAKLWALALIICCCRVALVRQCNPEIQLEDHNCTKWNDLQLENSDLLQAISSQFCSILPSNWVLKSNSSGNCNLTGQAGGIQRKPIKRQLSTEWAKGIENFIDVVHKTPNQAWAPFTVLWLLNLIYLFAFHKQQTNYRLAVPPEMFPGDCNVETFLSSRNRLMRNNLAIIMTRFGGSATITIMFMNGLPGYAWSMTSEWSRILDSFCPWNTELRHIILFTYFVNLTYEGIHLLILVCVKMLLCKLYGPSTKTWKDLSLNKLDTFCINYICSAIAIVLCSCPLAAVIDQEGICVWIDIVLFTAAAQKFRSIVVIRRNISPVPPGALRDKLELLSTRVGFPINQIVIINTPDLIGSDNAGFLDLIFEKWILAGKTLSARALDAQADSSKINLENEVLAAVAHEMGHWNFMHCIKLKVISTGNVLCMLWVVPYVLECHLAKGNIDTAVKILTLVFVLQFAKMLMVNFWGKQFEYEADGFAVKLGYGQHLKSVLKRVNKSNLLFGNDDPIWTMLHDTHPPILQRVEILEQSLVEENLLGIEVE